MREKTDKFIELCFVNGIAGDDGADTERLRIAYLARFLGEFAKLIFLATSGQLIKPNCVSIWLPSCLTFTSEHGG